MDVNGDGFQDLLVAAKAGGDEGQYPNATYVFFGPMALDSEQQYFSAATADVIFYNEESSTATWVAASAGDLNGDGYEDLYVKGIYSTKSDDSQYATFLFYGPNGDSDIQTQIEFKEADVILHDHGNTVRLGDINLDGFDDLAIGGGATVEILFGPIEGQSPPASIFATADIFIRGSYEEDYCGQPSSSDVTGDGLVDLVVSCTQDDYVFFAPIEKPDSQADLFVKDADSHLVARIDDDLCFSEAIPDVNGDGIGDILCSQFSDAKAVRGLFGPLPSTQGSEPYVVDNYDFYLSEDSDDYCCKWVAYVGDVNGDRVGDLFVRSSSPDVDYYLWGPLPESNFDTPADLSEISSIFTGGSPSHSPIGDLNHDGIDDLVLSYSCEGNQCGGAFIYRGRIDWPIGF